VRGLRRALAGLALAIAVYLGAALLLGLLPANRDFAPVSGGPGADGIEITVTSNGFHTDLILPLAAAGIDWAEWCPPETGQTTGQTTGFIGFGWGDRDFYLETRSLADLRAATALHALWFSSDVLIHVTAIADPGRIAGRRRVTVAPAVYRRLADYVRAAFRLDAAGRPIRRPEPGYGAHDAFYEAVGTYSPFRTCNEWLAAGLRQAGIRTGWWAPFAFGVTAHL